MSIGFGFPTGPYETFLSLMGGPTETGGFYGAAGRIVSYVSTQQGPDAYYAPDVGIFFGAGFANPGNCCASVSQVYPQSGSWLLGVPVPQYGFAGFFVPVANPPAVNTVKAGQSIPAKWHLSLDGVPVSEASSFWVSPPTTWTAKRWPAARAPKSKNTPPARPGCST